MDAGEKERLRVERPEIFEIEVELLLQAIFMRYHYDFRHYSRSSIHRRLEQLLQSRGFSSVSAVQERLLRDADFLPEILNFLTVPTSEMFRDPSYFASLRAQAIPFLKTWPSIKIWIAGCSTGEEVWSFAILLKEEGLLEKTILYATDINPESLEKAKRGIYSKEAVRKAHANYQQSDGTGSLSDYYSAAYDAVRFDSSLARNVVFSDHSLATDSVFAEVHLVSCRNVLIYFDRELQDRAIGLFKDSLVNQGFLGLGSKESLHFSRHKEAFEPVVADDKLFQKRA